MSYRQEKQKEKKRLIESLCDYGLEREKLECIETHRLRKTLHAIKKEMENVVKPVRIVLVDSMEGDMRNEMSDECSFCDTDDSECEYCEEEPADYFTDDDSDSEISVPETADLTESEESD